MARPNMTTMKVSLQDIETIAWALYCLDKSSLSEGQQNGFKRLLDRLERAEERVL